MRFDDPALETAFLEEHARRSMPHLRVVAGAMLAVGLSVAAARWSSTTCGATP